MNDMIMQVKEAIIANGGENIYSSFDSIPVRDKGRFFTVLSISGYEAMQPIYTRAFIYMPVKAELSISVIAPSGCTGETLYDYYDEKLESAVNRMCGLNSRLKSITITQDSKLCRPVLNAVIKLSCMKKIPVPEEDADD